MSKEAPRLSRNSDEAVGTQKVVLDYLESLLAEPAEGTGPDPAPLTPSRGDATRAERTAAGPPAESVPHASAMAQPAAAPASAPAMPLATAAPASVAQALLRRAVAPAPAGSGISTPAAPVPAPIAGEEINCVLIRMHGLNLALPFDGIEGVLNLASTSMRMDYSHDWIIGSFGQAMTETSVVDTAMWLIPERYEPERANYQEILLLQGRHWALACDELVKSVRIPTRAVSWSGDRGKRPWLMGTYMPERCALVDVKCLLDMFNGAF